MKFKQYKQISKNIDESSKQMSKNYEELKKQLEMKNMANEKKCKTHIQTLKASLAEKKNNGGCAEYSNMTVSIFNSEHLNNEAKKA
jgi:DNA repair exonuclease SbcCD ATPase subunit